ncbi:hypothetical protein FOA52_012363 [Chlamydomonas sp. UWO 241]|nr:hypothetical protein FOA52_012363 [Chlamydomonas sp. UWO 241]
MTEFWKSNKMAWCDICKVWMNDRKDSILNHERGMGHQEKLKRKLRDMVTKADQDKRDAAHLETSMAKIEKQAAKQYEIDRKANEEGDRHANADAHAIQEAEDAAAGRWAWVESSKYYYNAPFRWYYDPKTEWYYGGDPPEWAQVPPAATLPAAAKFGVAPHDGGPVAQREASGAGASTSAAAPAAAAAAATAPGPSRPTMQRVVMLPAHPQAMIGGHAGPEIGRVGAAKGLTDVSGTGGGGGGSSTGATAGQKAAAEAAKRKRDEGKPMSAADAEANARREAARARVANRTAQGFGFL